MFTGIISAVGTVVSVEKRPALTRFVIESPETVRPPEIGASIACNGVCFTIVEADVSDRLRFRVEAGPETLALTTASGWEVGTRLNLERALRMGDELGGHLVSGHVDGLSEIVDRVDHPGTVAFRFRAPKELSRFVARKGSVSLDGTSLTVNSVDGDIFECHLIPHTLAVTTWQARQKGDRVNLEVDLVARYTERLLAAQ